MNVGGVGRKAPRPLFFGLGGLPRWLGLTPPTAGYQGGMSDFIRTPQAPPPTSPTRSPLARAVLGPPDFTAAERRAVLHAVRLGEVTRLGLTHRPFDPDAPLPRRAARVARRAERQLSRCPLSRIDRRALLLGVVSARLVLHHQSPPNGTLSAAHAKLLGALRVGALDCQQEVSP